MGKYYSLEEENAFMHPLKKMKGKYWQLYINRRAKQLKYICHSMEEFVVSSRHLLHDMVSYASIHPTYYKTVAIVTEIILTTNFKESYELQKYLMTGNLISDEEKEKTKT